MALKGNIDFKSYLYAQYCLAYYENHPDQIPDDWKKYDHLIGINLGYNNERKYTLLLDHCFKHNDTVGLVGLFKMSIAEGVYSKKIEDRVKSYPNLYEEYRHLKNEGIKSVNFRLLDSLKIIAEDDQHFRGGEKHDKNRRAADSIDNYNFKLLLNLTYRHGWLWSYRFDTICSYEHMKEVYEFFAIISHFNRAQICALRDIALTKAMENNISWDEVILLQQLLYWKRPNYYSNKSGVIFCLEFTGVNNALPEHTQRSLLELYTLGYVVMNGMKNMKIEICPTQKLVDEYPASYKNYLVAYKSRLITSGVDKNRISVNSKSIIKSPSIDHYYIYYRLLNNPIGRINLPQPYSLIVY